MANGTFTYTPITAEVTEARDILPAGAHTGAAIQNQGDENVFINSGSATLVAGNSGILIAAGQLYEYPGPISEPVNIISSVGSQACLLMTW